MGIEDIDVIETHALQRLIAGGDEVFSASPLAVWTRPHVVACLGRDDEFVTIACEICSQDLSERRFSATWQRAVIVGEIKVCDAKIERLAANITLALVRCVIAEIVPEPE